MLTSSSSEKVTPFAAAKASDALSTSEDISSQHLQQQQTLLQKRTFDGGVKNWGPWSDVCTRPESTEVPTFVHCFPHDKGQLCIYANILPSDCQKAVTEELMQCSHFRQYTIQGSPEPRTHFLLHDDATEDFDGDSQPGYGYGNCVRMKSRPLDTMPHVQMLSTAMEKMCRQLDDNCSTADNNAVASSYWNIGVNPILYRDGRDRIGYHADDDQGEELILSVLVSSPVGAARKVSIRRMHSKNGGHKDKDEEYQLFLGAGDAYSMDGKYPRQSRYIFVAYNLPGETG